MRTLSLVLAMLVSLPEPAPAQKDKAKPRFYSRVRVLCIGVENYQAKRIGSAKYSINDVRNLGSLFETTYGFEVEYLTGAKATRQAVQDRLDALCKSVADKDVVIVYFAGHGIVFDSSESKRHGFLVPYDADVDLAQPKNTRLATWEASCIDMQKVVKQVEACNAHHAVVIADACCSGYMAQRGSLEMNLELRLLLKGTSRIVLAATTENQGARWNEVEERGVVRGHGVFTNALIQSLKTYAANREPASVTDVFVQLRKELPGKTEGGMLPQMGRLGKDRKDNYGEFVFLPLSITEPEVKVLEEECVGLRGRSRWTRGLADRLLERQNGRTRLEDVIEAYDTNEYDYRFGTQRVEQEKRWRSKLQRLLENASLGDPLAMAALHYYYALGLGVEKDAQKAYHWAQLAHESGHAAGEHVLGRCLYYGYGTTRSGLSASAGFEKGAKGNFPISYNSIAFEHREGGRLKEAREWFELARKAKVLTASGALAQLHLDEATTTSDDEFREALFECITIVDAASKAGHPGCQYQRGRLVALLARYSPEKEAATYRKSAHSWVLAAAKAGHPTAQRVLARELARDWWMIHKDNALSLGLKQDYAEARKWAEAAASQGDPEAYLVLASMYETGCEDLRLPPDDDKAREYCLKAMKLNSPLAFILQSRWLGEGKVLKKDRDEAFRLALRAVKSNDTRAHVWIAALYADNVVPTDLLDRDDRSRRSPGRWVTEHYALKHFTIAAARRHPQGVDALKEFTDMMARYEKDVRDKSATAKRTPKPGELKPEYWEFFLRDFPDHAKLFRELTEPPKKKR